MNHTIIKPTVGRKVHYIPSTDPHDDDAEMLTHTVDFVVQPLDATVIAVYADDVVNLSIFDIHGHIFSRRNVKLLQEGDRAPSMGRYAQWMPYQIGQAKKEEPLTGFGSAGFTHGTLQVVFDPWKQAADKLAKLSNTYLENIYQASCRYAFIRPTDLGLFDDVVVTRDDVAAELVRRELHPDAPLKDNTPPPVDNDHVADGCEKFDTPPSPMAAYSLDEVRRAWDSIVRIDVASIFMDDGKSFTQEQIHAELDYRGDGAYCAV